ncbi:MAG: hypothetical protein ACFFBP_06605 [Promethearchaeota archaeon]
MIGTILGLYLCINFLVLTFYGFFIFNPWWEDFGVLITFILIFIFGNLLIFCISGFTFQNARRIFGIIMINIAGFIYPLIIFFTYIGITSYMPDELWPFIIIGSNGLCLILIGGILYVISKKE